MKCCSDTFRSHHPEHVPVKLCQLAEPCGAALLRPSHAQEQPWHPSLAFPAGKILLLAALDQLLLPEEPAELPAPPAWFVMLQLSHPRGYSMFSVRHNPKPTQENPTVLLSIQVS